MAAPGVQDPIAAAVVPGASVIGGEVLLPALVLLDRAVTNNLSVMAGYARHHGFELMPHGKTTMAPALFRRQLEAGATGITVANVTQAQVALRAGATRVLVANEIVGALDAVLMAQALAEGDRELFCLVDSPDQVAILDVHLARAGLSGQLGVFVELGIAGGRTGVRSLEEGIAVARAVEAAGHLRLVGVEGFEGSVASDRSPEALRLVDGFLGRMRQLTRRLGELGAFSGEGPVLVSAGGSKYFDRVAEALGPSADYGGLSTSLIVRSGCYLTHDHGIYEAASPLGHPSRAGQLLPALELWAEVLSTPEPGLAIIGLGKRDTSFDLGLPLPLHLVRRRRLDGKARAGAARDAAEGPADGVRVEAWSGATLVKLDDQHGYLRLNDAPGDGIRPGDRIGFGISHPCTAFDRWSRVLLVDDSYRALEVVATQFGRDQPSTGT